MGVRFPGYTPRPTGLGVEQELLPHPHLPFSARCPARGRAVRLGGLATFSTNFPTASPGK